MGKSSTCVCTNIYCYIASNVGALTEATTKDITLDFDRWLISDLLISSTNIKCGITIYIGSITATIDAGRKRLVFFTIILILNRFEIITAFDIDTNILCRGFRIVVVNSSYSTYINQGITLYYSLITTTKDPGYLANWINFSMSRIIMGRIINKTFHHVNPYMGITNDRCLISTTKYLTDRCTRKDIYLYVISIILSISFIICSA